MNIIQVKRMMLLTTILISSTSSKEFINEYGIRLQCVPITDCPQYLDLLKYKPVSQQSLDTIRAAHCAFVGIIESVWCPEYNVLVTNNSNTVEFTTRSYELVLNQYPSQLPSLDKCGIFYEDRIIGGSGMELDEHPWLALLEYYNSKKQKYYYKCGGALISDRYVLTAAHCIVSKRKRNPPVNVILGEYDTNTKDVVDCKEVYAGDIDCGDLPITISIERIEVHPNWDVNIGINDIALIRLANAVKFSDFVAPVCLPTPPLNTLNTWYVVAGWGKTEEKKKSNVKLKVSVAMVPRDNCSKILTEATIDDGKICAGAEKGKDSCNGDSGGPMVYVSNSRWYAIGIVSLGAKRCAQEGIPGVYTYIPKYIDWIYKNLY